MRLVIFLSILLLFASCRSHKEVQREVVDTSHVEGQIQASSDSAATVLDLLRSVSDIDLSGITVNFFPPDSLHPHIRAVPKSIHIDKAHVKESSDAATLKSTEVIDKETVNLRADTATESKQESTSDVNALSPPGYLLVISILIAIVLVSTFVYFKFFHKS